MADDLKHFANALIDLCYEVIDHDPAGLFVAGEERQQKFLLMLRRIINEPSSPVREVGNQSSQQDSWPTCTIELPTAATHKFSFCNYLKEESCYKDPELLEDIDYNWKCIKGLDCYALGDIAQSLEIWINFGCKTPIFIADSPVNPLGDGFADDNVLSASQPETSEPQVENKQTFNADTTTIPPVNKTNGNWVRGKEAAEIESLERGVLRNYRLESEGGIHLEDGMCGKDRDGRIWRKPHTPQSQPWYLKETLTSKTPQH